MLPVVFTLLPQWKHVLKGHKTPLSPPFPASHSLLGGKLLNGVLCRALVAVL